MNVDVCGCRGMTPGFLALDRGAEFPHRSSNGSAEFADPATSEDNQDDDENDDDFERS